MKEKKEKQNKTKKENELKQMRPSIEARSKSSPYALEAKGEPSHSRC